MNIGMNNKVAFQFMNIIMNPLLLILKFKYECTVPKSERDLLCNHSADADLIKNDHKMNYN